VEELKELGKTLELQKKAFDDFKKTNNELLEAKAEGKGVAELETKLAKMESDLTKYDDLQAKMAQVESAVARGATGAKSEDEIKGAAEVKAFEEYLRKGCDVNKLSSENQKAMTPSDGPNGQYLLPPTMISSIEKIVFETSPIRSVCSVTNIGAGNEYKGLYDDDEAGADWEGLNQSSGNSDTPTYGEFTIPVHRLRARPQIHEEMLDDSFFNLESELTQKVGDRMGRRENTSAVNGDGVKQYFGFQSYADAADEYTYERGKIGTFTTAVSATLDYDDVINLTEGLKDEYHSNARLAGSRQIFTHLRTLKDQQGQYLWMPSLVVGQPATVNGFATVRFNDMPTSVASSGRVLAIADWSRAFKIVDRVGISVLKDPYTVNPYIKYVFRKRTGGQVVNFDAIKRLTIKV
jgi:HK97 family phage major capsid protein